MIKEHGALGQDLRRAARGRVLVPGDLGFEAAASPWNLSVLQKAKAVVNVADARDAAAVVAYARRNGLGVAAQAAGHGATRALDEAILVRTGALRGVEVDADRAVARIQPGALWDDVLAPAAAQGLTGPCGSSSSVPATGDLLGGGLSWFSRAYGPGSASIRAAEIVDAEGVHRRVIPDSDAGLMWALRGGGGDFALVTALEIDLYPALELYGGRMLWPGDRVPEVLAAFREATAGAPEELTAWFSLLQLPQDPRMPEALRGLVAAVDVAYLGDPCAGRALTRIFDDVPGRLLDTRGQMSPAALGDICAEPIRPAPVLHRGELLTGLTEAVAEDLLDAAGHGSIAPLTRIRIRHLGGALARPTAGACRPVAEPYALEMLAFAYEPGSENAARARQDEIAAALAPHLGGHKPLAFLRDDEPASAAFPSGTLARLRALKHRHDPYGVFRGNHPVLG